MPVVSISCDFYDVGSTTYVSFPTGSLSKFAKAFHDGAGHKGEVLLVLNRERQMLKVVTREEFDILNQKLKSRSYT